MKRHDHQPTDNPAAAPDDAAEQIAHDYEVWKSHCSALIDAAAIGALAYAREWSRRSRHGTSPDVVRWFAECGRMPGESDDDVAARVAERITDKIATWKNYGGSIRKLGLALANGDRAHETLVARFGSGHSSLTLSRISLGEGCRHRCAARTGTMS
jgi:hypothetical protein